jgi:hypothetical protein
MVKVDQRTPNPILFDLEGIQLTKGAKYLGFDLRDDLSMNLSKDQKREMAKALN